MYIALNVMRRVIENKQLNYVAKSKDRKQKAFQTDDMEIRYDCALFVCLLDLILYVPSTIFQLNRDGSSWVEPVLS